MGKKKEEDNLFQLVRFSLPITKPGVKNKWGITFNEESYLSIMNSEVMQERLRDKTLFLIAGSFTENNAGKQFKVRFEDVIGSVVAWSPEKIMVEMSLYNYNRYIKPYRKENCRAGIMSCGKFIKEDNKPREFKIYNIAGFQLLLKDYTAIKK